MTVCAEIVGGQLTPPDRVSFRFLTESITAIGKLQSVGKTFSLGGTFFDKIIL